MFYQVIETLLLSYSVSSKTLFNLYEIIINGNMDVLNIDVYSPYKNNKSTLYSRLTAM